MTKEKHIVWVGGIPNHFDKLIYAQIEQKKWINKGYDDVIIETIKKYNYENSRNLFNR